MEKGGVGVNFQSAGGGGKCVVFKKCMLHVKLTV